MYGAWGQQQQATSAWGQQQAGGQQGWGQQYQQQAAATSAWGQQQQAAAPAAAQQAAGGGNKDVTLVVTGCAHGTVGGIVRGSYQLHGENHGKPTYKKDGQVNGLDVMSYFWDERDGAGFCGWWFGPKVGGDQVWAYHTDKQATMPPQTGWKVPYDGPVDATFNIAYKPKSAGGYGAQQPAQQAQPQQQWGQAQNQWGQQQQQQQQNQWGQQQNQQQQQEQARLNQQRQQLEEMKKKQMMENQMRAQQGEQMRAQQVATQQQNLQANQMKMEQANMARIEAQKKKMEEMKLQQQQMIAQRQEQEKKKQADAQAQKTAQIAVLNVRRVMQKFKATQPEKFEEGKVELEAAVTKEAANLGPQREILMKEVQAAITSTKERIEKVLELKKKEEEKKEAENNRRKELKQKATELVAELEKMVAKAEKVCQGVVEEADPFTAEKDMKIAEIEACASAVDEAGKEANEQLKVCTEFIVKESAAIKNTPPIIGEAPATCAADLTKLVNRVNEAKKTTQQTISKASIAKTKGIKKAEAKGKYEKSLAVFKTYDKDKDGKLSRREIQAYSKGEFNCSLPAEALDSICDRLIKQDAKGVDKADFHKLRVAIGVAREAVIDGQRTAKKLAREKHVEGVKEKLKVKIEKITERIKEAGEAASKAEKAAQALVGKRETVPTATEMTREADEVDKEVEASKKIAADAKESIAGVSGETEAELKGWLTGEVKKLQAAAVAPEAKINKAAAIATKHRAEAVKKNLKELEKLRADGLAMIFHHQGAKGLSNVAVYEAFDKKKTGKIQESAFVKFFQSCELKEADGERMSEEDAARLFQYIDEADSGHIKKDDFLLLIRKFMKVTKASVMTDAESLKSKPLRRLNEGEVVECLTGPTPVEGEEVTRIKVRAMEDAAEGWVTPVGNRGTVFIEDGGDIFKVVKESILTGSFVIGEDKGHKDIKLKVGELLEVREWARKEEVSGLERMKVRVKSDGQVGWVTTKGNTGIKFVEVCL